MGPIFTPYYNFWHVGTKMRGDYILESDYPKYQIIIEVKHAKDYRGINKILKNFSEMLEEGSKNYKDIKLGLFISGYKLTRPHDTQRFLIFDKGTKWTYGSKSGVTPAPIIIAVIDVYDDFVKKSSDPNFNLIPLRDEMINRLKTAVSICSQYIEEKEQIEILKKQAEQESKDFSKLENALQNQKMLLVDFQQTDNSLSEIFKTIDELKKNQSTIKEIIYKT